MSKYFASRAETAHHNIFPGVDIFTMHGAQLMLSLVEMQPNAVVKMHQHPHEQLGMLLEGEIDFTIGDEQQVLRPGQMWRIPGDVPHQAVAGPNGCRALDLFHPIREDYT